MPSFVRLIVVREKLHFEHHTVCFDDVKPIIGLNSVFSEIVCVPLQAILCSVGQIARFKGVQVFKGNSLDKAPPYSLCEESIRLR